MPNTPLRPCAGGCGQLVRKGKCAKCNRRTEWNRGTRQERGYDSHWLRFRQYFFHLLIQQHIMPVCGAALPTGPQTTHSQCKQHGWLTTESLHLDHEPPLRDDERDKPWIVCNPQRIQCLCASCHAAKTQKEQAPGGVSVSC